MYFDTDHLAFQTQLSCNYSGPLRGVIQSCYELKINMATTLAETSTYTEHSKAMSFITISSKNHFSITYNYTNTYSILVRLKKYDSKSKSRGNFQNKAHLL
jgi:hypothetical protein